MKRKFTDNIPLKVMSLAVGILVWAIVVNVDNPVDTKNFIIPNVEVINEAYVEDSGRMCMLDDKQNSVRVTITGRRKTLDNITTEDIWAVADLQQAVSLDTDPVMVPITAVCEGISQSNISVYPKNLSIHLEEKLTQEYIVSVNSESRPGRGYEIGRQTVTPEKVRVTGPKSLLKKIDKVTAQVNVDGITEDTVDRVNLSIIDKNADTLDDTSMNYLKIDNEGIVTVTTKLWNVRTDVKLQAGYVGEPAEGFVVDSVTTIPDTLSIAGNTEALDTLRSNGNMIEIPPEEVEISGESKDVEKKVNLAEVLPENMKLTTGASEDILVRVSVLPEGSQSYDVPTSDIKVNHKPEDLQVTFEIDRIEIRVKADKKTDLEDFDIKQVKASIDLEDKEEGTHSVPVTIELPDGYKLVDEVTTEVKISKVSVVEENQE